MYRNKSKVKTKGNGSQKSAELQRSPPDMEVPRKATISRGYGHVCHPILPTAQDDLFDRINKWMNKSVECSFEDTDQDSKNLHSPRQSSIYNSTLIDNAKSKTAQEALVGFQNISTISGPEHVSTWYTDSCRYEDRSESPEWIDLPLETSPRTTRLRSGTPRAPFKVPFQTIKQGKLWPKILGQEGSSSHVWATTFDELSPHSLVEDVAAEDTSKTSPVQAASSQQPSHVLSPQEGNVRKKRKGKSCGTASVRKAAATVSRTQGDSSNRDDFKENSLSTLKGPKLKVCLSRLSEQRIWKGCSDKNVHGRKVERQAEDKTRSRSRRSDSSRKVVTFCHEENVSTEISPRPRMEVKDVAPKTSTQIAENNDVSLGLGFPSISAVDGSRHTTVVSDVTESLTDVHGSQKKDWMVNASTPVKQSCDEEEQLSIGLSPVQLHSNGSTFLDVRHSRFVRSDEIVVSQDDDVITDPQSKHSVSFTDVQPVSEFAECYLVRLPENLERPPDRVIRRVYPTPAGYDHRLVADTTDPGTPPHLARPANSSHLAIDVL